jgi:general secretion pathway protein L
MATSMVVSRARVWSIKAQEHVRAFGRWWLKEFLALFPRPVADWMIERGSRTLLIVPEADAVGFQLLSDRRRLVASSRMAGEEYSAGAIDVFLKAHGLRRSDILIDISLPPSSVFSRSFTLPLETRRSLDAIVVQDLVAKTPFRLDAIHHAHVVDRVDGKLAISQWVVRRDHVDHAAEALGLAPGEVAFIEAPGVGVPGGPVPTIMLRQAAHAGGRWVQWTAVVLALTALALTGAAIGTTVHRQQLVLDDLSSRIAATRVKAKGVMAMMEQAEREQTTLFQLRASRGEPGLLDIWEEVSRILPPHTWVSELRLSETADGRQVVMTGFSAAAASLVGLIDQSPLFKEAALVGAVTMDQTEHKERFVIQASLGKAGKPRTATR